MTPHWSNLIARHGDEQECLASFLAWQAAEVVARVKPANLITVHNRTLACGRNLYRLWEQGAQELFAASALDFVLLKRKARSLLVLVYDPGHLQQTLDNPLVSRTLAEIGYPDVQTGGRIDPLLGHLAERMQADIFPHEVGFFLGYPVKDVLGFMGRNSLPLVARGAWKIYGPPAASHAASDAYRTARHSVRRALLTHSDPCRLFRQGSPPTACR